MRRTHGPLRRRSSYAGGRRVGRHSCGYAVSFSSRIFMENAAGGMLPRVERGPVGVASLLPCGDLGAGIAWGREQHFVQEPVVKPTVKALGKAVPHRLSGRDGVPVDAGALAPGPDRRRNATSCPIVDDGGWPSAPCRLCIESGAQAGSCPAASNRQKADRHLHPGRKLRVWRKGMQRGGRRAVRLGVQKAGCVALRLNREKPGAGRGVDHQVAQAL